jgi:hypothetical protein
MAAAAAAQPGTKYLVATDDAANLTDSVRKSLMFADHVVIAHRSLLPHVGVFLGAMPADFAGFGPLKWVEAHRAELATIPVIPHYRGAAAGEEVKPFLEWVCGEGRPWVESGFVTYAPNIIPSDVLLALIAEDVNLTAFLRRANVMPSEDRLVNWKVSAALAQLRIPYLHDITPEVLRDFKGDEADALSRFQRHVAALVDAIQAEAGSAEFSRQVDILSAGLADETATMEKMICGHAKTTAWRRVGVEVLGLTAAIFFLLDLPQAALGTISAAAVAAARELKESVGSHARLKENPVVALSSLGALSKRPKSWLPTLARK